MYKNEKSFSLKNIKIKEDLNKNKKYTKINKKCFLNKKSKSKNNTNKYSNKLNDKEKTNNRKLLNDISKLPKKTELKKRNQNRIDITMNFNMTNFTTYNDTNKILEKKYIENYSGKKEAFHKRQISDGFQKVKVINTPNFLNIKVNTKDNKTSTNKQIQNMKKINNNNQILKNKYINYDLRNSDELSNNTNYLYNSHKDLKSYDNSSKLKINISEVKIPKDHKNVIITQKKITKNNINKNLTNSNMAKSAVILKKKEKVKNNDQNNIINDIPIKNNLFSNNIILNNNLLRYKKCRENASESKKILKNDSNKKILLANSIKDKKEKNKKNSYNNYNIILPKDRIEIFPIYMNTTNFNSNKTNIKYKINNSCEGLNNIKGNNIFQKSNINSNKISKNNTNRQTLNFINDKNKKNGKVNNTEKKNENNDEKNPEIYFFNIIKMIQKSKNSVL